MDPDAMVAAGTSGTYWPTIGLGAVRTSAKRMVTTMQNATNRPFGVTVIAILLAIHGVIAALAGLGVFGPYPGGALAVTLQLLYAVLLFFLAYGMYTFEGWAWLTTLAFQVLNIIFTVALLFQAPGYFALWILLVLEIAIVAYLLRPSVSSRFTPPQPNP